MTASLEDKIHFKKTCFVLICLFFSISFDLGKIEKLTCHFYKECLYHIGFDIQRHLRV